MRDDEDGREVVQGWGQQRASRVHGAVLGFWEPLPCPKKDTAAHSRRRRTLGLEALGSCDAALHLRPRTRRDQDRSPRQLKVSRQAGRGLRQLLLGHRTRLGGWGGGGVLPCVTTTARQPRAPTAKPLCVRRRPPPSCTHAAARPTGVQPQRHCGGRVGGARSASRLEPPGSGRCGAPGLQAGAVGVACMQPRDPAPNPQTLALEFIRSRGRSELVPASRPGGGGPPPPPFFSPPTPGSTRPASHKRSAWPARSCPHAQHMLRQLNQTHEQRSHHCLNMPQAQCCARRPGPHGTLPVGPAVGGGAASPRPSTTAADAASCQAS